MVESLLSEYPNVLVLRVRMPIVGDLLYPRNFITKIIKYEKVILLTHAVLGCNPLMMALMHYSLAAVRGFWRFFSSAGLHCHELFSRWPGPISSWLSCRWSTSPTP